MAKYQSRLDKRSKKNTNKILNIMIAVVVLLIVVVGGTIIMGNDNGKEKATSDVAKNDTKHTQEKNDTKNKKEENNDTKNKKEENKDSKTDANKKKDNSVSMKDQEDQQSSESNKESDEKKQDDQKKDEASSQDKKDSVALKSEDESKAQVEESNEPNVKKSIVHPDWKPVGTSQSGEHVSSYKLGSVDWNEKLKAISYATGIPEDNMTVWYIEGNGGPQKSIGTVTRKGESTAYRVFLQWVDGKGWEPTKVQELVENDKD